MTDLRFLCGHTAENGAESGVAERVEDPIQFTLYQKIEQTGSERCSPRWQITTLDPILRATSHFAEGELPIEEDHGKSDARQRHRLAATTYPWTDSGN